MINRFVFITLTMLLFACKTKKSEENPPIISEPKFVRLLIDYHLAQGINNTDSFRQKAKFFHEYSLADSVLALHGINRAQFDSTLAWYSRDPKNFNLLYDRVMAEFSRRIAELQKQIDEEKKTQQADTLK